MPTDKRLARRASEGDERAFATIFRRYHQDLYRYCLAILGNPEDAQDALQNTMLAALRALPGESREIELKPWLYRIAHNESIDLVRRRRSGEALDPELAAAGSGLAQEAEARERLGRLLADLGELPERQRGALLMRELAGFGFEEIGAALGCTAAVARQTTYEARLGLREFEAGREMDCVAVTKALSDADGRVARRRDIRSHLRECPDCSAFQAAIKGRRRDLAALSPLPALLGAGLLKGVLGGGGAGGGGLAAGGGGIAGSVALKGAATLAVVAALGVGAERGGLIDPVLPGGGKDTGAAAAPVETTAATGSEEGTASAAQGGSLGDQREGKRGVAASAAAALAPTRGTATHEKGSTAPNPLTTPGAAPDPGARGKARGRGPKPSLPAAAAKGHQKAAGARGAAHGRGAEPPVRPEHPAKPASPAKPAKPEKPAAPEAPAAGEESSGEAAPAVEPPVPGTGNGKKASPTSPE